MVKKSDDELLAELLKKQDALKNRIASIEARKRKEDDKLLTRKKILLGAFILEKYKDKPEGLQTLVQEMDKFLTRANDRKIFNLPVIEEAA